MRGTLMMVRTVFCACLVAGGPLVVSADAVPSAVVTVLPERGLGPVKPMNAVNNGPRVTPPGGGQLRENFPEYRAARIPYARFHDSVNSVCDQARAVDVNVVFPDFAADENDPKNYDFVLTDHLLDTLVRAGTRVFYRLGQTIEHGPKKYGVLPPKDPAKWARICEHIVRHYNEGWGWGSDTAATTANVAWSNQFDVTYWEVWNEPDLDAWNPKDAPSANPKCWGGTAGEFYRFFATAARHLKGKFPGIKVGGPAVAGSLDFMEGFLAHCRTNAVPLDFFSWHHYGTEADSFVEKGSRIRALLDKYGFERTESVLDEWNYVAGWNANWMHSIEVEAGRFNQKCAAFVASTMIACQRAPVDMLMFYDAQPGNPMNALFDVLTLRPQKAYYPFYAWSKLCDRGDAFACRVAGSKELDGQIDAVAAFLQEGSARSTAILISRYCRDANVMATADVGISLPNADWTTARCHLTDSARTHTEVPLEVGVDGVAHLRMEPNSVALIEISNLRE